jgi:hypothetical protein
MVDFEKKKALPNNLTNIKLVSVVFTLTASARPLNFTSSLVHRPKRL